MDTWMLRPVAAAVSAAFAVGPAFANPTGAQVVSGVVSMARPDARTLNVTSSPGAIIHWQGFSIAPGELTRFNQQSASSAVLNRVVGADISQIHGQLLSNGRVFLINPAGIVIGPGGVIDTAGFVGSTLDMAAGDFLSGKLKFQAGAGAGAIVNHGWIRASAGGNVLLIAPQIENRGVIETQGGDIVLAAGGKVTIGSPGLEGIQFEVQARDDSVLNVGKLLADEGAVGVFAGSLRHSGDIRANALARDEAGRIVLKAKDDVTLAVSSTTRADGKTAGAVTIQSESGTTLISGAVTARGTDGKGGQVRVLGERVGLIDNALVDVSGEQGGGQALIGGDYRGLDPAVRNASAVYIGRDARVRADAIGAGDGGRVIVWSKDATRTYGQLSAQAGAESGNGGFVETSGRYLEVGRAPEIGKGGSWLLDRTTSSWSRPSTRPRTTTGLRALHRPATTRRSSRRTSRPSSMPART